MMDKCDTFNDDVKRMELINKYYDHNFEKFRHIGGSTEAQFATTKNADSSVITRSNDLNSEDDDASTETASNSDMESLTNEIDAVLMKKSNENAGDSEEIFLTNVQVSQPQIHQRDLTDLNLSQHITDIVSNSKAPAITNIERVAIQASSDILFGNKTYINGPTTVIYMSKSDKKAGKVNEGFDISENEESSKNIPSKANKTSMTKNVIQSKKSAILASLTIAIIAIICFAIVLIIQHKSGNLYRASLKKSDGDRPETPSNSTAGDAVFNPNVLNMIPRSKWLAQPPNAELNKLDLPVNRVIIIHTATETCKTPAVCVFNVRHIQTFHMESYKFDDIGYNFVSKYWNSCESFDY